MIIQDKETTIEQIGNVQEESQFKMRNSQKAFQILSSLYSDKPLAIVRELGCNAMDSHIASGQPNRPFHIHIPNSLEPWLTIQDFGTGISHENIYEIYSVYFASTKTNTNTQVGMLGLGSKSPFCYTDNFTVTSIHNQVKRIYNAYFNQQGMPTIALASQENTSDENGVAIQIPIKNSDIDNFTHAIYKAFRFFDTKPTISGGDVTWSDVPSFEGTFWKSYHKKAGYGECTAIMGGVAYPIDFYKLDDEHYDIARKAGLVIHFNIGELDVTPSRESLMYHDWVIKALNEKIELVKKDFVTKVEDQIQNSDNLLDALKTIYLLNNEWSFLNSSLINKNVKWKNIDITDPRKSIKAICLNLKNYSKRTWGRAKWSESEYPSLDGNALWYVDDLKKGTIKRTIAFIRSHQNSNVSVNLVDNAGMSALIKSGFPANTFIPASTLPVVTASRRASGAKSSRPKGIISLYSIGYQYQSSWDSESFDLATGTAPKYYVIKHKDNWMAQAGTLKDSNGNVIVTPTQKGSLQEVLNFLGIDIVDVRMVAQNNAKFLDALGSKNLADVINKKKVSFDIQKVNIAKSIEGRLILEIVKNKDFQKVSVDNPFKKMILELNEAIKDVNKIKPILNFIRRDENFKLTFPSKMVEMMYHACISWQVGIQKVVDVLLEQEQIS